MSTNIRDKMFYCDSEVKWKALMEVLKQRDEPVGPATARDYDPSYSYFSYHDSRRMWCATRRSLMNEEVVIL